MKRYLLFAFSDYYPNGGMKDLRGDYDNINEIIPAINRFNKDEYKWDILNKVHVLDTKYMKHTETYDCVEDNGIDLDEANKLIQELKSFES